MRIKTIVITSGSIITFVFIFIMISGFGGRIDSNAQGTVGFPYEVKLEKKIEDEFPIWKIRILLSKEFYSKENLERLFNFFSSKHSDQRERRIIEVYTDHANLLKKADIKSDSSSDEIADDTQSPSELPSAKERRFFLHDAIFFRQNFTGIEEATNEWFKYIPDLSKPNERETVVMKGKNPYARKD